VYNKVLFKEITMNSDWAVTFLGFYLILHHRSELRTMSVNAQVIRLKKQLDDAERRQQESAKVHHFNWTLMVVLGSVLLSPHSYVLGVDQPASQLIFAFSREYSCFNFWKPGKYFLEVLFNYLNLFKDTHCISDTEMSKKPIWI